MQLNNTAPARNTSSNGINTKTNANGNKPGPTEGRATTGAAVKIHSGKGISGKVINGKI